MNLNLQGEVTKNRAKLGMINYVKQLVSMMPKFIAIFIMSHGKKNNWQFQSNDHINTQTLTFRIQFTDAFIQLDKLLEPLLAEQKLASIPILIGGHFCRGNEMNWTATLDATCLTSKVNAQEKIKYMVKYNG